MSNSLFHVDQVPAPIPAETPVSPAPHGDAQRTPSPLMQDLAAGWPAELRPVIDFVQFNLDRIPRDPFDLHRNDEGRVWAKAVNVQHFLECLTRDLRAGPNGPCARQAIAVCRALAAVIDGTDQAPHKPR